MRRENYEQTKNSINNVRLFQNKWNNYKKKEREKE